MLFPPARPAAKAPPPPLSLPPPPPPPLSRSPEEEGCCCCCCCRLKIPALPPSIPDAVLEPPPARVLTLGEGERVRVRPAIHRFADAVRGQGDPAAGLERLIRSGRAAMPDTADEQNEEGEP